MLDCFVDSCVVEIVRDGGTYGSTAAAFVVALQSAFCFYKFTSEFLKAREK